MNAYVSERKPRVRFRIPETTLIQLAGASVIFNVAAIALLLFICLDLAPSTPLTAGREYESLRLAIELLALLFVGCVGLWTVLSSRRFR